jgi:hypothetical protein
MKNKSKYLGYLNFRKISIYYIKVDSNEERNYFISFQDLM